MDGEQQLSKYEDVLQRSHFYKLRRDIHRVDTNYLSSSVIQPYFIAVTLSTAKALVAQIETTMTIQMLILVLEMSVSMAMTVKLML